MLPVLLKMRKKTLSNAVRRLTLEGKSDWKGYSLTDVVHVTFKASLKEAVRFQSNHARRKILFPSGEMLDLFLINIIIFN